MEEVTKLLGPWPILQFMFGISVLGFGVFMIVRGMQKRDGAPHALEDNRDKWAAYEQLRNIEENSFKSVELQRKLVEEVQRLTSVVWNRDKL